MTTTTNCPKDRVISLHNKHLQELLRIVGAVSTEAYHKLRRYIAEGGSEICLNANSDLACAFFWDLTEEGWEYWRRVWTYSRFIRKKWSRIEIKKTNLYEVIDWLLRYVGDFEVAINGHVLQEGDVLEKVGETVFLNGKKYAVVHL